MSAWSIAALNGEIAAGRISCAEILEGARARAEDPQGEGARIFRVRDFKRGVAAARAFDQLREAGAAPQPLAGLPVSIKDNIDIEGQVSAAGSKLLLDGAPALRDAPVVERLRKAGAVIVGRTNMSEFAFTGVGINPHFGTAANPFDRSSRRIPGGSSAGAAVSVTDRMAAAALGTDTGGSVRIPAALTGLAGFKPTQRRVPTHGVVPLSPTLDCVGPLASSVADCALLDAIMAGEASVPLAQAEFRPRFWLPSAFMLEGADAAVQRCFERALSLLADAGAAVSELQTDAFAMTKSIATRGSIATAEVWEKFGPLIEARRSELDPQVALRIGRGASMSAADYIANLRERSEFIARMNRAMQPFDAIIAPTVPIVAPPIAALDDAGEFQRTNGLILRNPAVANLLDAPSLTVPCHADGEAPVGLMLIGRTLEDRKVLELGRFVERILSRELGRA